MEEQRQPGTVVTSFLDRVAGLVMSAYVRTIDNRTMFLHLMVGGPMPPSWCEAIVAVWLLACGEALKFRVVEWEQNGSKLSFRIEPVSAEEGLRAESIIEERRTYFTNIERIELEITTGQRVGFANRFYLPKT